MILDLIQPLRASASVHNLQVVYTVRNRKVLEDSRRWNSAAKSMFLLPGLNGLASSINDHGHPCERRAAVAAKDLLSLPELGPALFEGGTTGVQTLDKYRVILEESG